jgi:hypothetical protein
MRFRTQEVFLGVFLTVAIFAAGMLFASSFRWQNYEQAATTSEQHTAEKKQDNAESAQSLWVPTDSVGLYTLVLAIFTALLALVSGVQGALLLRADKTARVAADAAKRSADAAFAAERARFFIVIESHNLTQIINNVDSRGILASGENFSIKYRFRNYGKTPGIIKALVLDSMIDTDPVEPPTQPIIIKEFAEYMIGADGSTKEDWFSPRTAPNLLEVQAIGRDNARLWFYGRLYYDDVFGNQQVHKFFFRSVRSGSNCILQPFEYKDHNKST